MELSAFNTTYTLEDQVIETIIDRLDQLHVYGLSAYEKMVVLVQETQYSFAQATALVTEWQRRRHPRVA